MDLPFGTNHQTKAEGRGDDYICAVNLAVELDGPGRKGDGKEEGIINVAPEGIQVVLRLCLVDTAIITLKEIFKEPAFVLLIICS